MGLSDSVQIAIVGWVANIYIMKGRGGEYMASKTAVVMTAVLVKHMADVAVAYAMHAAAPGALVADCILHGSVVIYLARHKQVAAECIQMLLVLTRQLLSSGLLCCSACHAASATGRYKPVRSSSPGQQQMFGTACL